MQARLGAGEEGSQHHHLWPGLLSFLREQLRDRETFQGQLPAAYKIVKCLTAVRVASPAGAPSVCAPHTPASFHPVSASRCPRSALFPLLSTSARDRTLPRASIQFKRHPSPGAPLVTAMDSMPACYCWTALCTALPAWGLGACTTGLGFGAFCVQSSNSRARPGVQLGSAQSLAQDRLFVPCSLFRVTKTKTDTGHEQAMNTPSSSGPGRQGGSRGRRGQQEMHLRESPSGSAAGGKSVGARLQRAPLRRGPHRGFHRSLRP